jgi:hypothetical protein
MKRFLQPAPRGLLVSTTLGFYPFESWACLAETLASRAFVLILGFELRAYSSSHSTRPFL